MVYSITKDENLFKKIWLDERNNTPRFFSDGSNTKSTTWDDFLGFCQQCDCVYSLNDAGLLYVERVGNNANIHFSVLRGTTVDTQDLIAIRDELFQDFDMIFGYVGTHNRPLKKIIESCGLRYEGFRMFYGTSHGKLLEWRCYSIAKNNSTE